MPGEPISTALVAATKAPFTPTVLNKAMAVSFAAAVLSKVWKGVATSAAPKLTPE